MKMKIRLLAIIAISMTCSSVYSFEFQFDPSQVAAIVIRSQQSAVIFNRADNFDKQVEWNSIVVPAGQIFLSKSEFVGSPPSGAGGAREMEWFPAGWQISRVGKPGIGYLINIDKVIPQEHLTKKVEEIEELKETFEKKISDLQAQIVKLTSEAYVKAIGETNLKILKEEATAAVEEKYDEQIADLKRQIAELKDSGN